MGFKIKSILMFFVLFLSSSYAALPPWAAADIKEELMQEIENLRISSRDIIVMRTVEVELKTRVLDECPSIESWNIKAVVEDVQKGELKKGDLIRISYTQRMYRCPGPQRYYPKELKKDILTSAYLKCFEKECSIASGAWSFDSDDEFLSEFKETSQENEYWKDNR